MVRVLIVGASKGIGLATVKAALSSGHNVRAFARTANGIELEDVYLEKRRGDALNEADIDAALDDVDVVVQASGISASALLKPVNMFSNSTRILVSSMQKRGMKRLIAVTGYGAGESRDTIGCVQRVPFLLVLGRAYDDKDIQERLIKNSQLDWTIVRPGILVNGPPTGRYKVLTEASQWRNGIVSRDDVADFIVRSIDSAAHIGQAPVIVM